jgi:hypothetical protein
VSRPSRFDTRIDQVVDSLKPWVQDKAAHEHVRAGLVGLLTDLRRAVAGDGPAHRPVGSLEHFDAACESLGVPFIEP